MKIVFCAERPVTALLNFRVRAQRTQKGMLQACVTRDFQGFAPIRWETPWFRLKKSAAICVICG
jgi:hypothetical protein